ncbi:MAG: sugar ABC transporter permease [Clostridia bacterium]|nr:sugar ABC transporter permease [Clostridia bacterium]
MKRKTSSLIEKRSRAGYVFCLPFMIGFILLFMPSILRSIYFSFCSISASGAGMVQKFIGIDNYKKAFLVNPDYIKNIFESVGDLATNLILVLIFSFLIAVLLNQKFVGRTFSRAIFFMPVITASGVIALMQADVFMAASQSAVEEAGSDGGISVAITAFITEMLSGLDVANGLVSVVTSAVENIFDLTTKSGVQILIFLAGLQSIPTALYEASSVEGATGWENLWKITLPMISPMILVNAIYTVVDSMAGLDNSIIKMLYETAFKSLDYGYSAAMGWVYFLLVFILMMIVYFVVNPLVFYQND